MTLAEQMDADFLDFDGLEEVTFITRRTDDEGAADDEEHAIDHALPSRITHREQSLGDLLPSGAVTRVWNLRKCELDAWEITPREGDVIKQDDETEWTIRSMELLCLDTRFRFVCTKGRD